MSGLTDKQVLWRLKSGADRRFRSGHPWVYSNELADSPKGIVPGDSVELRDASGGFLARGYGNPSSLIAFRAVSRISTVTDPLSQENLLLKFRGAFQLRSQLGMAGVSHRLCHGEADGLPGLIVDRYFLEGERQIFAIQAHTAGTDRILPKIPSVLEVLNENLDFEGNFKIAWTDTAVLFRNDLAVRELEGLTSEPPRVFKDFDGKNSLDSSGNQMRIKVGSGSDTILLSLDLLHGQKTGFFLDQRENIRMAIDRLGGIRSHREPEPLRILDLCCYVGQWGAQFTRFYRRLGMPVNVTVVDSSKSALEFAQMNIGAQGGACNVLRADVLKDLDRLPSGGFDLVISDPPALIKKRKDVAIGTHAYLKLNTQVLRLVREGGGVVSCSCSALLEEEEFLKVLAKAAIRNQKAVRWVGRGSQSPDHPILAEFPEGRYLKCWVGMVSGRT